MNTQYLQKVYKLVSVFLILVSLYFAVLIINGIKENKFIGSMPTINSVTVTGEGEVFATPDVAQFSFSVLQEGTDVSQAETDLAEKTKPILDFLKDNDIDDADIKTISFNANPRYEYRTQTIQCITFPCVQPPSKRELVGFEVSQTIQVKVRNIAKAGAIISGVSSMNPTSISGLQFTIDDEEGLQQEAREQAIQDAERKMKSLADDLGVDVVRVVSFWEQEFPGPSYYGRGGFEEDAVFATKELDIPTGENKISSTVSITYEIK